MTRQNPETPKVHRRTVLRAGLAAPAALGLGPIAAHASDQSAQMQVSQSTTTLPPQYYREAGAGPNVIMTHGTLMNHTMFDSQVDALAPNYHVLSYNLRGSTDNYGPGYTLNDLADDCSQVASEFNMQKFVLVGMSMGGFMALKFALKYPKRLKGLVLIGAKAQAYTPEEKAAFGPAFDPLDVDGLLPRSFGEFCVPLVWGPRQAEERPPFVEEWLDYWDTRPARSVYGEYRSWIDKEDLTHRLGEIQVPTLVVHGAHDAVLPVETCAVPLAEGIPNAELCVVDDAGHTCNVEHPEVVNDAMLDFLGSLEDQD
ncbi:alpha/beta fold hydrolase [Kribbella sp. CA-253562]|uniref:alpha/beta fold hydrolase n=1 Tax=Kribbella sp. CA-253562 TaxID=3239942 RepID=UPI003D91A010